jgi:hypothetical protein
MLAATCACLTWPAALISVSDWAVSIGLPQRLPLPKPSRRSSSARGGKGRSPLSPTPPIPVLPHPTFQFHSVDHRAEHRICGQSSLARRTRPAATRRRLIARRRPRPLPHLARLRSPPADDVVLKMRRQNQPSQPHPDTPPTRGTGAERGGAGCWGLIITCCKSRPPTKQPAPGAPPRHGQDVLCTACLRVEPLCSAPRAKPALLSAVRSPLCSALRSRMALRHPA